MASTIDQPRSEWPSIVSFYTDSNILITGATGFMGKCLVEKILYSVPGNGRVFLLVRPKKGKSVQERIDHILQSKVSLGNLGAGSFQALVL